MMVGRKKKGSAADQRPRETRRQRNRGRRAVREGQATTAIETNSCEFWAAGRPRQQGLFTLAASKEKNITGKDYGATTVLL